MKLLRYGPVGAEKPGCLDAMGRIRDLSRYIPDIMGDTILPERLAFLRGIEVDCLPLVEGEMRIGPCVNRVGKFLCVGLNYSDHAAEMGLNVPKEPILFDKVTSSICGPHDPLIIPTGSMETDWEVELGVIIGKQGKRIAVDKVFEHVAGYCVINDVSERNYQLRGTGQWLKGKGCDSFGQMGPWLVTSDEIPNPQQLSLWLEVDGKRYQDSSTRNMVHDVAFLVSYVSQFFSLYPGDVISTGTPAGVGLGQKPKPVFLQPGQRVRLGIEGLGEQLHLTVSEG